MKNLNKSVQYRKKSGPEIFYKCSCLSLTVFLRNEGPNPQKMDPTLPTVQLYSQFEKTNLNLYFILDSIMIIYCRITRVGTCTLTSESCANGIKVLCLQRACLSHNTSDLGVCPQQLPLFLSPNFDLRAHLESLGHGVASCADLRLTARRCAGFLTKRGGRVKTWKKRWFLFDMDHRRLAYYTGGTGRGVCVCWCEHAGCDLLECYCINKSFHFSSYVLFDFLLLCCRLRWEEAKGGDLLPGHRGSLLRPSANSNLCESLEHS